MTDSNTSSNTSLNPPSAQSYGSKEMEPTPRNVPEMIDIEQTIEHTIEDEELKQHDVQARPETITLSPDLKNAGLEADSGTQFPSTTTLHVPLSDEKIIAGLKAPPDTGIRWLATLAKYMLEQAHIHLKRVGGKVIREDS